MPAMSPSQIRRSCSADPSAGSRNIRRPVSSRPPGSGRTRGDSRRSKASASQRPVCHHALGHVPQGRAGQQVELRRGRVGLAPPAPPRWPPAGSARTRSRRSPTRAYPARPRTPPAAAGRTPRHAQRPRATAAAAPPGQAARPSVDRRIGSPRGCESTPIGRRQSSPGRGVRRIWQAGSRRSLAAMFHVKHRRRHPAWATGRGYTERRFAPPVDWLLLHATHVPVIRPHAS